MSKINLTSEYPPGFTLVPDAFIEQYMPHTNGEYIKVYLYMLKALRCGSSVDTSDIADALEKEEADIVRALKYWDKKGVFELRMNEKTISHICIKALGKSEAASAPDQALNSHALPTNEMPVPEIEENAFKASYKLPVKEKNEPGELPEDVVLLITAAEGYFNRTVTMSDRNIILYMYDELGLSFELIDYLFCRAVETGKTQLRYIEKVAISLHENEISTVKEAMKLFKSNSDVIHTVMHAFGLQSRNPTTAEQKYITKWSDTFGFDKELIEEACSRSALNTNSGNFQYADKILSSWHKAGVNSREDVERLDAEHKASSAKTPAKKPSGSKPSAFNNFEQRGGDIDELEKKLLDT